MLYKLLAFLLLLFSSLCFSQHYNVSGVIKNSDNEYITYANVIIYNKQNTEYRKGVTTNEIGGFEIKNLKEGNYTLKINYFGFETYTQEINLNISINLGVIILEENIQELEGIEIVAKRPTLKRMVDRLVFNVENTALSNSSVLDVLKHTPSVLVLNGKIKIKQSTPIIYINDRRVHLSSTEVQQLLEGTAATNVTSIEVITSPPARYDAEGGAVINIKTSKNIIVGYNGSVFGAYKQGSKFPKYVFGTSHFFKTKKLNTYLNYSISPRKDYRNNDEFVNFINNDDEITSRWETDFERIRETRNQNINGNIDYEINKNNSLGFTANFFLSPRANTQNNINSITDVFGHNKVLDSIFITNNRKVDETYNLSYTFDYFHKFKKEGEKISVSLHHTNSKFSSFQNVDTDYLFPDESLIRKNGFQTFSSQYIKLYTGQVDYELPIENSGLLEAGFKMSSIDSKSALDQFDIEDGQKKEDLLNSDTFLYDETNYALYSSYSKDWTTWSLKLGLRAELTNTRGNSLSTNTDKNNKYSKLFPSFYLLHNINDKNELYFNYNKRIHRPRYSQLNPFKYFLNDNSFITGDPNLQPQIDDTFILGYAFNQKYTFEIYYRYENDPAIEVIFQDNDDNILQYVNTNINRSISYGLDFSSNISIVNNWELYVFSSIYYYDNQFFAIESNNLLSNTEQWSLYNEIVSNVNFLKNKSLLTEVSFLYLSALADGVSKYSSRFSLNINTRKKIFNNRGTISLGINDIFNTLNYTQTTRYLNQDYILNSRIENRLVTFGFNYKFVNFRLKNTNKEIELNERDRLK